MLTYIYLLLWIYASVAEKEVYIRFQRKFDSSKCHLPDDIGFTLEIPRSQSHHLHLTRNDDININLPVYSVIDEDGVAKYKTEYYTHQKDSAIYHDIQNGASLMIRCVNRINGTDWHWMLDGHVYIGSTNHRLEPVLENGEIKRHNKYPEQHLYQVSPIKEEHTCNSKTTERANPLSSKSHLHTSRRKRATITLEPIKIDVAIYVDYTAYLSWLSRENNDDALATDHIKVYFTHVIAGVNMRYQSMSPGLDVSIIPTSITIFKSPALWIDKLLEDDGSGGKQVDASKVLEELQKYIQNNNVSGYDHLMAFTGYDLYSSGNEKFTTGLANIGTMCKTDGSSVSIVEDKGGFQSIVTAAHELGHGMDGLHDGANNKCMAESRYIMSPRSNYTETAANVLNPWTFSSCSVSEFETFFKNIVDDGTLKSCLTDSLAKTDIPDIAGKMAGQVYGPDEQCRHIHGSASYVCRGRTFGNESEVCRKMFCNRGQAGTGDDCESITPAHGTSCGNKKWCIQGECVQSKDAPTMEGDCIYGDQDSKITEKVDCNYINTTFNGYCYPENKGFKERCCETCERLKTGIPDCEYGDKVTACDVAGCGNPKADANYDLDCCGTCQGITPPTTTPTTTPTTEATTPSSCSDQPIVNGGTCSAFIDSKGNSQCYDPKSATACCATCSKRKSDNPECLYGDRISSCKAANCGATLEDGTPYDSVCCETCPKPTTTTTKVTVQDETTTAAQDATTTEAQDATTTAAQDATTTKGEDATTTAAQDATTTKGEDATTTKGEDETTTKGEDATTPLVGCRDEGVFEGVSCPQFIQQNGKLRCYDELVKSSCCETCTAAIDNSIPGCPYGDKDQLCSDIDFSALSKCSDTTINNCCQSCHDLVKPLAPVECQDGSGIGTLTCPRYVEKYGKRSCYETNVNATCCRTCYSHSDLKTTDCMFGDRTSACSNMKLSEYTICNEFTKTHCCSTCQLLEENQAASTATGIHLSSFNQWTVLILAVSFYYYV